MVGRRHPVSKHANVPSDSPHDDSVAPNRLKGALRTLWASYVPADRLWAWKHDGRLPIWMNHDAVVELRNVAFTVPSERRSPLPVENIMSTDHLILLAVAMIAATAALIARHDPGHRRDHCRVDQP